LWFIFFFKSHTAYEVASCFVGSEWCIRDRYSYIEKNRRLSAGPNQHRLEE